jgi:predicted metal-dependent peptidase
MDTAEKAIVFMIKHEPTMAQFALELAKCDSKDVEIAAVAMAKDQVTTQLLLNLDKLKTMDHKTVFYIMIHEFMHILMMHFLRKSTRESKLWNVATDLAINTIIDSTYHHDMGKMQIDFGLHPGKAPFDNYPYHRTAEEYYEMIKKDDNIQITEVQIDMDGGEGDGNTDKDQNSPGKPGQKKVVRITNKKTGQSVEHKPTVTHDGMTEEQIALTAEKMRAAISKACGKGSVYMEQLIEKFMKGQVDWRHQLRQYVGSVKADYARTIFRPNRRDDELKGKKRLRKLNIVYAVDVSGSMSNDEIAAGYAEVESFKSIGASIWILQCDDGIVGKPMKLLRGGKVPRKRYGCGGTDLKPVFKLIKTDKKIRPDVLIYMTDMGVTDNEFPKGKDRFMRTIWLSNRDYNVPFGRLIKIKI